VLFGGCGGDDVPEKVRVFGLKKLVLKRFTVRSTTRTLITDKNDHSAFTSIKINYLSPSRQVVSFLCWSRRMVQICVRKEVSMPDFLDVSLRLLKSLSTYVEFFCVT
jgi:hypothetical protein